MKIPLIVWIFTWIHLLPLAVALRQPSRLRGPLLAVTIWIGLAGLTILAQLLWSQVLLKGNNQFISYIFQPLRAVAILWAIAEWQVTPVLRSTVRTCIPLLLIWWLVVILFLDDIATNSLFGTPVHYVLILATALVALVTRVAATEEAVFTQDWFWMLGGIAVWFATGAVANILQHIAIAAGDWAFADRVIRVKSGFQIVGLLAITGGFLCPSRPAYSGVSSLPVRSR